MATRSGSNRPSGIAQDQAFRALRRGDYDYDAEVESGRQLFRDLRRAMLIGLAIVLAGAVWLVVSGDGSAAGNLFLVAGIPLLAILITAEGGRRVFRRFHG